MILIAVLSLRRYDNAPCKKNKHNNMKNKKISGQIVKQGSSSPLQPLNRRELIASTYVPRRRDGRLGNSRYMVCC